MDDFPALLHDHPAPTPRLRLLWQAVVECLPREDLGQGPNGSRGIVPITGGLFQGAADFEALRGTVLPGGADRQLLRADGVKELDALYEMRCEDGAVLTIRNRVTIDEATPEGRYALSHIHVTAPEGPWAWLNRRLILGSMNRLPPERRAVKINAWLAEP